MNRAMPRYVSADENGTASKSTTRSTKGLAKTMAAAMGSARWANVTTARLCEEDRRTTTISATRTSAYESGLQEADDVESPAAAGQNVRPSVKKLNSRPATAAAAGLRNTARDPSEGEGPGSPGASPSPAFSVEMSVRRDSSPPHSAHTTRQKQVTGNVPTCFSTYHSTEAKKTETAIVESSFTGGSDA
ncbi:MAG: hypothetical protein ACLSVD_08915 [Eggerthellaceae bacterium]